MAIIDYLIAYWHRGLRVALLVFSISAVVIIGILAYLSWQYVFHFTHTGCIGPRDSLDSKGYSSEPVVISTPRGYQLNGWLTRGTRFSDTAIIVLPGASGNTYFALPDALVMAKAGYSTLVYEHRSCSDPALLHSGGYWEADDLVSAAQYLHTRSDIRHIGVLGFSAGGTAALLAAAKEPVIEAIVAQGGFSSLEEDVMQNQSANNPLDWIIRRFVLLFLGQQLGVPPSSVSPLAHIAEIKPRPVFLIYGEFEADHGQALYAAAGEPRQLWIVTGVGHGGYQAVYPDEYEKRVIEFFNTAFTIEQR